MCTVDARTSRLLAVIAAGGVLGSLGRLGVGLAMAGLPSSGAWATLAVNVIGCLVIGVVASRLLVEPGPWWHRPFWITGVLGGFTTFSAYALEAGALLDDGQVLASAMYLAVTVVAGLAAVGLGSRLARRAA